jgi:phage FluMu protein Com
MAVSLVERPALREVRCGRCAAVLFKAAGLAHVAIICRNCKQYQTLSIRDMPPRR